MKNTGKRGFVSMMLAILMTLVLLAGTGASAVPVQAADTQFSDVRDSGKYYYNAVYWAKEHEITSGTEKGKFSPESSVKRGQMITFVYRYYKNQEKSGGKQYRTDQSYETPFRDVKSSAYYADAVAWAYANGITSGTSGNTFSPENTVTRAQMITFLFRASCKFAGTEEKSYQGRKSFDDVDASKWYGAAACWAMENGVASGVAKGRYNPDGTCTRGQGVTLLYRAHINGFMNGDGGNGSDDIGSAEVSYFEDGSVLLHGVKTSVVFRIRTSGGESLSYHVTNASGANITCASVKDSDGSWYIQPPKGGYASGGDYTLQLGNGTSFTKDIFRGARSVEFIITEPEKAEYDYADEVVETDSTVTELSNGQIRLPGGNVEEGDILIGTDSDGNRAAWKVDSVSGNTAKVSTPALDEVFDELEVHKTFPLSAENMTKEDQEHLEQAMYDSDAAQAFADAAGEMGLVGAGNTGKNKSILDNLKCTIETDKEDPTMFVFEMSLDLKPDNAEGIRNAEFKMTARTSLDIDVVPDISLKNHKFDVAFQFIHKDDWDVNVDYQPTSDATDLTDKMKQAFEDSLDASKETDFISALYSSDDEGDKIGDGSPMLLGHLINYPIPEVPVLSVYADLDAFFDLDLAMQAEAKVAQNDSFSVGVKYDGADDQFKPYSDFSTDGSLSAKAVGKLGAKGGIGIQAGLCVITSDIAHVDIMPKAGAYVDAAASARAELTTDSAGAEADAGAYAEIGGYLAADVNAGFRLVKNHEYSHTLAEKKFPWKTWGSKKVFAGFTASNTSLTAVNGKAQLPEFKASYYDIDKAERTIGTLDASELRFQDSEGRELSCADNVLDLSGVTDFPAEISAIYTDATNAQHILKLNVASNTVNPYADFAGYYSKASGANFDDFDYYYLKLNADGTFSGEYRYFYTDNSRPGTGNFDENSFSGSFDNLQKLTDTSYTMTVDSLVYEHEPGTSDLSQAWYDEGNWYNAHYYTEFPMFKQGTSLTLYLPGTDKGVLTQHVRDEETAFDQNTSGKISGFCLYARDKDKAAFRKKAELDDGSYAGFVADYRFPGRSIVSMTKIDDTTIRIIGTLVQEVGADGSFIDEEQGFNEYELKVDSSTLYLSPDLKYYDTSIPIQGYYHSTSSAYGDIPMYTRDDFINGVNSTDFHTNLGFDIRNGIVTEFFFAGYQ